MESYQKKPRPTLRDPVPCFYGFVSLHESAQMLIAVVLVVLVVVVVVAGVKFEP